jgi:hypothetical protein
MKTRAGWVSNSSSTSFVIGLKLDPWTYEEAYASSRKRIDEAFPDFPSEVHEFAGESYVQTIGHTFFEYENPDGWIRCEASLLDAIEMESFDEIEDDGSDESDTWLKARELLKEGYRVYLSRMPHDGEGGSRLAHEVWEARRALKVDGDDFVLYFQGGLE